MTYTEKMETSATLNAKKRKRKFEPSHAFRASLRQAAAQKRLTVGLHNCVSLLKRNPEKVMVCLLLHGEQEDNKDLAIINIQQTLLQAFCTENRISTMHVFADISLMQFVAQLAGQLGSCSEDCSLVSIEFPAREPSTEDLTWAAACQNGHLDLCVSQPRPSD